MQTQHSDAQIAQLQLTGGDAVHLSVTRPHYLLCFMLSEVSRSLADVPNVEKASCHLDARPPITVH
jgi:hypothetical protein